MGVFVGEEGGVLDAGVGERAEGGGEGGEEFGGCVLGGVVGDLSTWDNNGGDAGGVGWREGGGLLRR